ncbi:MAG TPA: response regulator [Flavisolibacter sp.]|nr:response regulator [Flavisolibacter sp.]
MKANTFLHIIVVDDDEDDRYMIDSSFRQVQWMDHIKILSSGESLFRHLDSLPDSNAFPSLILLDYHMPRIGAEEILLRLKRQQAYANINVAVYSTEMSDTLRDRLLAMGAVDCYTKRWNANGNRQLAEALKTVAQQNIEVQ